MRRSLHDESHRQLGITMRRLDSSQLVMHSRLAFPSVLQVPPCPEVFSKATDARAWAETRNFART